MHVTLDGAPAAFGWSGCATLGELVARAERACAARGRAILGFRMGERDLDLVDRKGWEGRAPDDGASLAFRSLPVGQLVAETLDEMRAHFPLLRRELEAATAALRAGREAAALDSLGRVVSLWQACLAVAGDVTAALPPGHVAGEPMAARLDRLRAAVGPLDEALRRRDLVLVADLCAYEIPPLVDQWEEAIGALRRAAAAPED